jgi:hypothetical protein
MASVGTPPARACAGLAADPATTTLFGGVGAGSVLLGDTWSRAGGAWSQALPAASPTARRCPALAFDAARGQILLFGGAGATANLGDTWSYR